MALTQKPREAVLAAFHAPGVTLARGRDGFSDCTKGPAAPKVSVRTANMLVETGMAVFDDPVVPSTLTLTPDGIQVGRIEAQAA